MDSWVNREREREIEFSRIDRSQRDLNSRGARSGPELEVIVVGDGRRRRLARTPARKRLPRSNAEEPRRGPVRYPGSVPDAAGNRRALRGPESRAFLSGCRRRRGGGGGIPAPSARLLRERDAGIFGRPVSDYLPGTGDLDTQRAALSSVA